MTRGYRRSHRETSIAIRRTHALRAHRAHRIDHWLRERIGRACAETLAREGDHVVVSGRNTERGERTVDKIRAMGGTADFIAADLGSALSAASLTEKALAVTGSVDILVNNTGIYTFGPTASTTEEAFDAVYDLNVKAPYFLVRALAPPWPPATRASSSTSRLVRQTGERSALACTGQARPP